MSVKLLYRGRLANQLLIYLMGQYFAERNNLRFDENFDSFEMNKNFIMNKSSGNLTYDSTIEINDINVKDYLEAHIQKNIYLTGQFQMPVIFQNDYVIQKYKSYIIPKKVEVDHDLFIHVRLGDIQNTHGLPFSYYDQQISRTNFKRGIVSSDSLDHPIVKKLMEKYNLDVLDGSPEFTIRYGSYCKNIVLSYGSFSLLIGLLSNDSNVYFINDEKMKGCFNISPWMGPAFDAFVTKKGWILFQ